MTLFLAVLFLMLRCVRVACRHFWCIVNIDEAVQEGEMRLRGQNDHVSIMDRGSHLGITVAITSVNQQPGLFTNIILLKENKTFPVVSIIYYR